MSKLVDLCAIICLGLSTGACCASDDRGNSSSINSEKIEYTYISYDFGKDYFCIPLDDFGDSLVTEGKEQVIISKKLFKRSESLITEGGLSDRLRFYSGKGQIAVRKNIPKGHGYFIRVLKCLDLFDGSESVNGFSAYIVPAQR